jgi:hypothetical protein
MKLATLAPRPSPLVWLALLLLALPGAAQPLYKNAATTNLNPLVAMDASPFGWDAYYVDASRGNDTNSGRYSAPWATVARACQTVTETNTVYLSRGVYASPITSAANWVMLPGASIELDTGGTAFVVYHTNAATPTMSITGGALSDLLASQTIKLEAGNTLNVTDTTLLGGIAVYTSAPAVTATNAPGLTLLTARNVTFRTNPLVALVSWGGANNIGVTGTRTNGGVLRFVNCSLQYGIGTPSISSTNYIANFLNCDAYDTNLSVLTGGGGYVNGTLQLDNSMPRE